MQILPIAIAVGVLIFAASLLALFGIFKVRLDLVKRLHRKEVEDPENGGVTGLVKRLETFFRPLGQMLPRSPAEMSRQEKKLVMAGYRRKDAVILFYSAQMGTAIAVALMLVASGHMYQRTFACAVISLLLGAALPDIWLKGRIQERQLSIQNGLPDCMDLAVVAVEAGLGLDQALARVGHEMRFSYPALADEMQLRNLEVNMGRSRSEALRNFADRIGIDDVKSLVAILIQTDKFGTSVGQALRTFSDSLRTKRRQRAEEQAAKLAIKMIVPMVVFIFPAVFVVILGPPFIAIIRDLLPMLAGD